MPEDFNYFLAGTVCVGSIVINKYVSINGTDWKNRDQWKDR